MSYNIAVTVDLGPESTGVTVNGQLYNSAGSTSGSAITTGIVELGTSGLFQYVATLADGFVGTLVLYQSSEPTNRAAVAINPQETENADVKVSTRMATFSYSSPPTAAAIDAELSGSHGAGSWVGADISSILTAIDNAQLIPAASAAQVEIVGSLTIVRASTFVAVLSVQSIPSDWTSARFTVKLSDARTEDDSQSVLQILVTNPASVGTDGLVVLNGSTATLADASATVNQPNGTIAIVIEDDATAQLLPNNYLYDVKFFHGTSKSGLPFEGRCKVVATPTQTV